MPKQEQSKAEVLQGTLDLIVLRTLETMGPQHGFGLARRIEQVSGGLLYLNQGTLYPALIRLEQRGWIRSRWGVSGNNRKAKFYELTAAGRRQVAREAENWARTAGIMERFLQKADNT
jgi:transcriptional regulator